MAEAMSNENDNDIQWPMIMTMTLANDSSNNGENDYCSERTYSLNTTTRNY